MSIIRTIHGNAISKERKCARFKEKYFFKKLTKNIDFKASVYQSTLWLHLVDTLW